jgi:ribose transport system substrate-binding protein
MKAKLPKGRMVVAAAALPLILAASTASAETPSWCGPKKASIALLDGFGGNSWRLITRLQAKRKR